VSAVALTTKYLAKMGTGWGANTSGVQRATRMLRAPPPNAPTGDTPEPTGEPHGACVIVLSSIAAGVGAQ